MANETIKILQKAAFQLEAGKSGAGQTPGWGTAGAVETLGANDAFPYLTLGKKKTVNFESDNSIVTEAFKDTPVKMGELAENEFTKVARYEGFGNQQFWVFGFENLVKTVVVFVLSTPTTAPTSGAVYHDAGNKDFTFVRKETLKDGTFLWVFASTENTAPSLQTGSLTKQSGTGDATLTFSAHSGKMYEHLYELDAHERHLMAYRTAEQITGYGAGDLKCRMATIGIKMGPNDYRYPSAMCKGFTFKSSAGKFAEESSSFIALTQERGNYSSANWTLPSNLQDSDLNISHHQVIVQVGTAEGSLVSVGATDLELGMEIPLQVIQDTVSGQYMAEPVMEGKYTIKCGITLSRHSADTYPGYRDNWTDVIARIAAHSGYYMTEYLTQQAKVVDAGPDDSEVAKEQLTLELGYSSNQWTSWLYGNTLIQNGPIVMRVRNYDTVNHMFEI